MQIYLGRPIPKISVSGALSKGCCLRSLLHKQHYLMQPSSCLLQGRHRGGYEALLLRDVRVNAVGGGRALPHAHLSSCFLPRLGAPPWAHDSVLFETPKNN